MLVTASSGVTVTAMTRDLEGRHTTDPTHVDGTTVRMAVIKEMFEDVHDRIDADESTNAAHRADSTIHFSIIDEDDMTSNSATAAPSQQSVKAYVDAQNAAQQVGASLGLVIALS